MKDGAFSRGVSAFREGKEAGRTRKQEVQDRLFELRGKLDAFTPESVKEFEGYIIQAEADGRTTRDELNSARNKLRPKTEATERARQSGIRAETLPTGTAINEGTDEEVQPIASPESPLQNIAVMSNMQVKHDVIRGKITDFENRIAETTDPEKLTVLRSEADRLIAQSDRLAAEMERRKPVKTETDNEIIFTDPFTGDVVKKIEKGKNKIDELNQMLIDARIRKVESDIKTASNRIADNKDLLSDADEKEIANLEKQNIQIAKSIKDININRNKELEALAKDFSIPFENRSAAKQEINAKAEAEITKLEAENEENQIRINEIINQSRGNVEKKVEEEVKEEKTESKKKSAKERLAERKAQG